MPTIGVGDGAADILKDRARRVLGVATRTLGDLIADVRAAAGHHGESFASAYGAVDQWLDVARSTPPPAPGARRNRFWAEWAAYCCCRMRMLGHEPVLLYSEAETQRYFVSRVLVDPNLRGFWRKVVGNDVFRVADLDRWAPADHAATVEERARFDIDARMSLQYDEGREALDDDARVQARISAIAQAARNAGLAVAGLGLDRVVLPSGTIGVSAGLLAGFTDAGVPVATVESWGVRDGWMAWNLDRRLFDFDYRGWFDALGSLTPAEESLVETFMRLQEDPEAPRGAEFEGYNVVQQAGGDQMPAELAAFLARPTRKLILGTNVIGDSATLGRDICFEGQLAWIDATLAWLDEHPDVDLIVRIHPAEAVGYCPHPMAQHVAPRLAGRPNVHLVEAATRVNTFAIGRQVSAGVLYVSNLATDLVARDIPCITVSRAPYHGLGIAQEPRTPHEYVALLDRAVAGELAVTDAARAAAYKQIYVFTRLLACHALPKDASNVHAPRYAALAAGDAFEPYYRLLAGDASRADRVRELRSELG